jgi:hypothetical protein
VVTLPSCEPVGFSRAEVRAAVALELGTSGLALETEPGDNPEQDILATIHTTCEPGAMLELHAEWGAKTGERTLQIADLPPAARARAIALALAELLAGLRSPDDVAAENVELEDTPRTGDRNAAGPAHDSAASAAPARTESSGGTKPSDPARTASTTSMAGTFEGDDAADRDAGRREPVRPRRPALALSGEFRSFEFQSNTLGMRLHYDFSRFGVGFATLLGNEAGTLGVESAIILHAYFEGRVTLLGRPDATCLALGPRAGLGVVEVRSTPNPGALGTTVAEPYVDLASFLELSQQFAPFRVGARLELGYALGMVALEDNRRLASYAGPFGSVVLDVAWVL